MRSRTIPLLVLTLLACADLERTELDSCGNGVVEPEREDCDTYAPAGLQCGSSASSNACRFTCSGAHPCPEGWRCAKDGACVHATASWTTSAALGRGLDDWALGDVDGDGHVDVVGLGGGKLETHFGTGQGTFSDSHVRHLDRRGPASFRDADGDGLLDVAVPTALGVLVFTGDRAREVAPQPLAYSPQALDLQAGKLLAWGIPIDLPPALDATDGCQGLVSLSAGASDFVDGVVVPVPLTPEDRWEFSVKGSCSAGSTDPGCLGRSAIVFPRPAAASDTEGGSLLLAFPESDHLTFVTPRVDVFWGQWAGSTDEVWNLGRPHAIARFGPALAHSSASGTEVLIPCCHGARPHLLRGFRAADGKLAPFVEDERFELGDSCRAPLASVLASADFNGDALADYLLSTGKLLVTEGGSLTPTALPVAGAAWREAVVGDFNGDQQLDIAAVRSDTATIDVLYASECNPTCQWTLAALDDLAGEPALLTAADLDGTGGTDVAFVVRAATGDRLQVAFAGGSHLAEPETVAVFEGVQRLEAGRFRDAEGLCDGAKDLLVSRGRTTVSGYSLLVGSGHGALYAPLVLGEHAVVEHPRQVVLAANDAAKGVPWLFAETTGLNGRKSYTAVDPLDVSAVRIKALTFDASTSCSDGGQSAFLWVSADVDGDGVDEVVGVERQCDGAPASSTTRVLEVRPESPPEEHELPVAVRQLREMAVADLDGDGALDLALAHADGLTVHFRDAGGWSETPLEVSLPDARSLALLDADAAPTREVATLAAGKLRVFTFAGRVARELWSSDASSATAEKVRAADVDEDGVDDLLVSEADRIVVLHGTPHRPIAH